MYDLLKKKYEELVFSLIEPVFQKILSFSWKTKALTLMLTALIAWGHENLAEVERAAMVASNAAIIILNPSAHPPISNATEIRRNDVAKRITSVNTSEIHTSEDGSYTGWVAAQTLLAISSSQKNKESVERLIKTIRKTQIRKCLCWGESNTDKEDDAWIFISGWVMAALAESNTSSTDAEIDYLLENQNTNGSWNAIGGARNDDDFPSTYTTAWSVIGLSKQLESKLAKNQSQRDKMKIAIDRATSWLLVNRASGARWKPYPNMKSSTASESISGLVVYALNLARPDDITDVRKAWLENLPNTVYPASAGETKFTQLWRGAHLQTDHFIQLTMPWTLIATIDSYKDGDLIQKSKALHWIEATLMHNSVKDADREQNNWWRSELLIALNHAREKSAP
ncbi:MAG: terpene cyclase/mutase family protein [Aquabacterium sp.]|uniref:hypothetical protein n=1 Tax=Aquabacterium sp. TaxID=1872578 RepID=UPI001D8A899C|nr:hypothetical protein [Aquabacterium sp.]MBT9610550.1 terpene cyclase/mutase family protein [Aquabacterium sp.]